MPETAYLDHAATAGSRPPAVAAAVAAYITDIGATPGRGGHQLAHEAGRVALRCRQAVAKLLDLPGDPGRIAFMANATHALNTALWGTLQRGDRVVVTQFDHNAVLRPCAALARERGVTVALVPGRPDGSLDEDVLQRELHGARMLVINAASNVLGTRLDAAALCAAAHDAGALALVDVAQLAGHVPFSVAQWGADLVAFTGQKGLLGPQGIGGLWARSGVEVEPLLTGGTGGDSMQRAMPHAWPDHLEAGTQNGPGMAGLLAGIGVVQEEGVERIHARLAALAARLHAGLSAIDGVRVLSPTPTTGAPIITVTSTRVDPSSLAAQLDREFGVLTRPGLHCAPEVHRLLGTTQSGALRFSLGWSSTAAHVDRALAGVAALLA
jgi:cysteine desulfurase / selenocysteine lyase